MGTPGISTLALYGGAINDYAPVTDPTTDRTSGGTTGVGENQAYADIAAMTHGATRVWCRFVGSATAPALANVNPGGGMSGELAGALPTPSRFALGVVLLTYPTTYVDELGNTQTWNFRAGWGNPINAAGDAQVDATSPNVITVYLFNAAGSASDFAGVTISIFVI